MLKLQGSIKGIRVAVSQNGMSRQVTFDVAGDSILDELQEIMMKRARLNISIERQQLTLGDIPQTSESRKEARV